MSLIKDLVKVGIGAAIGSIVTFESVCDFYGNDKEEYKKHIKGSAKSKKDKIKQEVSGKNPEAPVAGDIDIQASMMREGY